MDIIIVVCYRNNSRFQDINTAFAQDPMKVSIRMQIILIGYGY